MSAMRALVVGAATFTLVATLGCGGIAVVEKDDGGAGGSGAATSGASTGSGATASTGTGTTASSGSGGTTHEQSCAGYCANLDAVQCTTDKCFDYCVDAFSATNCTEQWKVAIACFAGFLETDLCNVVPPSCQDEVDALEACGVILCMPNECSGSSDGSCSCKTHCATTTYEADCKPNGGGSTCTCLTNGVPIGTCPGGGTCPGSAYATCCVTLF